MYAKLFKSLYQGTLRGNSHGLLVFTNLLANADMTGVVDMHPRAIAEEVGLTQDQVRAALLELEAEDIESRSPEEGGRRLLRLDDHRAWGWRIVNYLKYRSIRNEEDRREQNRLAQERFRNKQTSASSKQSKPRKPMSAHTEAEAEEEAEAIPGEPPGPPAPAAPSGKPARKRAVKPVAPSAEAWEAYSCAYAEKYGAPPVRNEKVNSLLAQLVKRLGADEAPKVAAFYLGNRNGLYASSKHCVDLLVRDCEKLRTEWATGNVTHRRDAAEDDRLAATGAMWGRVSERLKAKGIE